VKLFRFALVGASGLLVNSAALFALYQLAQLPLVVAEALAVELAIANNFVWNDLWTFRSSQLSATRFIRFNFLSLGGLAITSATVWLLVQSTDIHYLVANSIGITLGALCNFAANVRWTWRQQSPQRQPNAKTGPFAFLTVHRELTAQSADDLPHAG
jgi:dolichol-phosphate mannosyltransferase